MKNFREAKKAYMDIKASEELLERVEKTMKKNKPTKNVLFKIISAAACFCVVFVGVLNAFPKVSYSMYDIPVLGQVVRVVTFNRYEHKENGYETTVVTPKIEGLLDKELTDKLNAEFKENADFVIAAYENDVRDLKKEFGDENVHLSIESDYVVKTDNENILALDVYIVNNVGSSSTRHSYYNIDKNTGELLTLEKMFEKDVDYVEVINKYIVAEMKRQNAEDDTMFWIKGEENSFDGFESIEKNQKFYINSENKIAVCFDKYQVAPGYMGSPEFVLPDELLKDLGYRY